MNELVEERYLAFTGSKTYFIRTEEYPEISVRKHSPDGLSSPNNNISVSQFPHVLSRLRSQSIVPRN